MYFDAVLSKDMTPIFNGSPDDTKEWLKKNETKDTDMVCDGRTLKTMTVKQYLGEDTPEQIS